MRILAVASGGGHWVELLRLQPAFEGHEVIYMSTSDEFASTVKGSPYYTIPDFSQWDKTKLIPRALQINKMIGKIKPDMIITTGAAPGVISLLIGKLKGAKTVWIESMCHAEKVSVSGKMASLFADKVYTQWEHLSGSKIHYAGNIMI